jgi:hypothetical protein
MPLTVCKKCNKIISSGVKSCPYCGAAIPQDAQVSFSAMDFRNAVIGFLLLVLMTMILILSNPKKEDASAVSSQACQTSTCPAGTKAVTSSSQQEPYYTCKSGELSDYANYVLSVMLAQINLTGISPKITSKTGEPVVPGNEQLLLDKYRANAGVSSFDEALSKCYRGIGHLKVTVLYNPKDGGSSYVSAEANQDNKFWLPKAKLNKR